MSRSRSFPLSLALVLATAGATTAQTGVVDQDNTAPDNVGWNMGFFYDFQQDVRVATAGQLEGFTIRMATQTAGVGLPVALFLGPGPHPPTETPVWSSTAHVYPGGYKTAFIDVTTTALVFNAGDVFTIRVGDGLTPVMGTSLVGNEGLSSPFYPENFFDAGVSQSNQRLYFRTYVIGCAGTQMNYGQGCPGTGGYPELLVTGCPVVNDQLGIKISKGLGGANALLVFGLGQGSVPIGHGCTLHVAPVFGPQFLLTLSPGGPGKGTVLIVGALPPSVAGVTFTTQAFVFDPSSPAGVAATNAAIVNIP